MISKSGIHAVRALTILATLPEGVYSGAAAIASQIGAPANYLGKLLQILTHHGIVESRKGAGGGFRLARQAGRITLLDAVDPIDQVARWERCFLRLAGCSVEHPCVVHDRWSRLRDQYLQLLADTSIADIVDQLPPEPNLAGSSTDNRRR